MAAIVAVVLVSGVSGFGTFAYIAGNTEHVTAADGAGDPVITTTTTTMPETTTSAPEEEDSDESEDSEAPDAGHEDHESGDAETTTTSAPPEDPGGSSSGLGPEDTVKEFFAAMENGDCDTAINHLSEQSWSRGGTVTRDQAIAECQQSAMAGVTVQDTELAKEEGDSATVNVTISQAGQSMTMPMMLMREGGQWKLANM